MNDLTIGCIRLAKKQVFSLIQEQSKLIQIRKYCRTTQEYIGTIRAIRENNICLDDAIDILTTGARLTIAYSDPYAIEIGEVDRKYTPHDIEIG